jgi:hypothetical protein
MAEVLQLFSITRHLYQPDVLPLAQLQLESSLQRLRERYKFTSTAVAPGVQLLASAGAFLPEASTTEVPVQVVFASNAIEAQVAGETEVAEQFQQDLLRFLAEVAGDQRPNFPEYARSVQTIAIVRLLIPPEALISEKLNTYLTSTAVPSFATSDAETHVQLAHLQWAVSYTRNATDYGYEPKLFTIEPRIGTRPSDRTYYTQSPTDSKTHLRLLERLEDALR